MKFTKTLAAITAAALAVSVAAIPASAVSEEMGIKDKTATGLVPDQYNSVALPVELLKEKVDFALTDVITVSVSAADESVDDSTWSVCAMAQGDESTGWASNWAGTYGSTELTTTVEEVLKNDGVELDTLFKVFFKVVNIAEGTETVDVNYSISIAPATPEDDTTNDGTTDDETVGDSETVGETEDPVDVELKNAGTVVNDGGWRVNLVHPWAGEENMEAFNIVDATQFANSDTISVKFKVTNVTEAFTAWLAFATNDDTGLAYWGEGNEANSGVTQTPVTIDKDGYYVLTLTTDQLITVGDNFFLALQTSNKDEENAPAIELVAVKAGEALELTADDVITPGESSGEPTNPDTGVALVVVPAALAAAALATSGIVLKKRSK